MIEWLSEIYVRWILNLRILVDNPTENEAVAWLRLLSFLLLAVVMLRFGLDQVASRRLRQRASRCDEPLLLGLVGEAARGLGLKARPELFFTDRAWPPAFSHGIASPAIFLAPALVHRLSMDELKAVLTHETAHFRRRDSLRYWLRELLWVMLPLLIIQSLAVRFVFNGEYSQLAWWGGVFLVLGFRLLFRPWDRLRETSCDDQTVAVTKDPLSLARALIKTNHLGRQLAAVGWKHQPASTHAFVRGRSSLRGRVERLVDYRKPRLRSIARRLAKTALAAGVAGWLIFSAAFISAEENQLLIGSVWAAPCPSVLMVD